MWAEIIDWYQSEFEGFLQLYKFSSLKKISFHTKFGRVISLISIVDFS